MIEKRITRLITVLIAPLLLLLVVGSACSSGAFAKLADERLGAEISEHVFERYSSLPASGISISRATVTLPSASYVYDGKAHRPVPEVVLDGVLLADGEDFTVSYENTVDVGTATMTIIGTGAYGGTVTTTFEVAPSSLSAAVVTLPAAGYSYSGSAREPIPTVVVDGRTLTAGSDYTVSYANNVDVGTATVTVEGNGNYKGNATVTFKVVARSISNASVMLPSSAISYNGTAREPIPTVVYDGRILTVYRDYTIAYENNVDAGTATVVITGVGNYRGTVSATFEIIMK